MGKARRIILDTRVFEKAGDATIFFRKMLNRYSLGERVSDKDAQDLTALLNKHEEKDEKIGSGLDYFEVNLPPADAPPFSVRCFWLIRKDGSRIDISYVNCLKAKPAYQECP